LIGIKSLGDNGRGNYKNECVETKVVPEGAIQFKIPSKCSLEAVSVYHVIPLGEDVISPMPTAPVNEGAKTSNGETCICEGSDACPSGVHKSGGVPHDDIGIVYQQWCKCQQTSETSLGGTVENYALLGPVCPSYPESGLDSYCMINNDEIAFPKIVSCKFSIVLMQGVDVTLETTVKLGFGGAGEDYALAADMYVGIATSKLPRSCWGADTVLEILPDPSDQDLMCRSLRFLSQTLNKIMDVGETLSAGKHTLDLYPFRFRWPNTYFPEGEGYLPGTGKIKSIMKHMARVPVQKPRYCSDFGGLCTNDANLNFMNGSVCLANIGEGFKRPGPKRNSFRYLSVVYGLLGGDSCMETPNMKVRDLNMEMGLKFKHTMFDPDKVDIMSLLKLIPPAWEEMMKLLPGNENEKGMVTLLTEAMETQPLKDLPNPLGFDWVDEAKVWSLKSQLNAALKLLLPKKKEFEFDVGKMISKGMDKYKFTKAAKKLVMKDPEKCTGEDPQCIFIFPKMFKPRNKNDANGELKRRRDGGQGEQGELGDQGGCGKSNSDGSLPCQSQQKAKDTCWKKNKKKSSKK